MHFLDDIIYTYLCTIIGAWGQVQISNRVFYYHVNNQGDRYTKT